MEEPGDDTLYMRIASNPYFTPGHAALIVHPADYDKMKKLGWNMSKPDERFQENTIRIKLKENVSE